MLVLGIDPGLQETGYSYVEGATGAVTLLRTGVIRTPSRGELPTRLAFIYQQLQHLFDLHPSVVALEDIYATSRFPRTAIVMGHVRGVVCLAAAEAGIRVISLPPASVKQAIAGFGAASKRQIQEAVGRLLGVQRPFSPHEADASAMALTVLSRVGQGPLRADRSGVKLMRELRAGRPGRSVAGGRG